MDIVIAGGRLIDGSGAPWRRADLGIDQGRVVAIGNLAGVDSRLQIDAGGRIVCPGFIDVHSHADLALITGCEMEGRLGQGITTEVVGQDGLSYAPASGANLQLWQRYLASLNGKAPDSVWTWHTVGEYLQALDGRAANAAYLVPHGAVRVEAMGWEARPANGSETAAMRALVQQGLAEGAVGFSTGLSYAPSAHATTDEVVALCGEVVKAGGVYATHLRSYGRHLLAGVDEAIEIGRRSGVRVHISHLRVSNPLLWGQSTAILERLDRARESGVDVTFDLYPYTFGCAQLLVLLPLWAQSGGPSQILARLQDAAEVQRMVSEMAARPEDWSAFTLSNIPVLPSGAWDGARLVTVAAELGVRVEAVIPRLLLESELEATIVGGGGNEADNDRMFEHPACLVGSDGVLLGECPHPRGYGCYPRVLAHYVREKRVLSWETAIAKMTGLPAVRFNIQDRGLLRQDAAADVVVFDPERVVDRATFAQAKRLPEGFEWVLVNGQVVVGDGAYLGGGFGKALCHRSNQVFSRQG